MMQKNYEQKENKYNRLIFDLVQISINGLEEMYLPQNIEFALKKKLINGKIVLEGTNTRYTLINLIGLNQATKHGFNTNLNIKKILTNQISKAETYDGIGELGLLLWATSLISPNDLTQILTKVNFNNLLDTFDETKSEYTMELSWLLTGLLMASSDNKNFVASIGNLTHKIYQKIRNNYGGVGIFRHEGSRTIKGKLRGKIASFADQVYPIYAFALYAKQMDNEEALLISKECATKICNLQGENGEWFWHYSAKSGKVVGKHPIYSVHQDAMAPFALFAIQKASNTNFESYIYKGLDWFLNKNQLDIHMIDKERNAIWRAITPSNIIRKVNSTLSLIGLTSNDKNQKLNVVYECWSYHLGWILFAFAGQVNNSNNDNNKDFNFQVYKLN